MANKYVIHTIESFSVLVIRDHGKYLARKQPPAVFCKKGVLKSFANFLCWSLF